MKDLQTVWDSIWVLHEHSALHYGKNHNTTILSAEALEIVKQMMQAEPVGYVLAWNDMDYVGCVISGTRHKDYVPIYAAPQSVPAVCEWTQDQDFEMGDTYHSSCGELWSFIDGGPKENRVSYCHHCGKPVKLASAAKARAEYLIAHGIGGDK